MGCCNKCTRIAGILFLLASVFFVLQDLKIVDGAKAFRWSTIIFPIIGLIMLCSSFCKECQVENKK